MISEPTSYLESLRLDGRGFVVLGAGGGGIGTETGRALAEAGARLLLVDIDSARANAAAELTGGEPFAANILDRQAMRSVFDCAGALFGSSFFGVVDVVGMVNRGDLTSLDEAGIEAQFDIALKHAVHAIQIAGPRLAANGAGAMVFIGSLAGLAVSGANPFYGGAKAALHHLVRYAAREFGPSGVRVNAVAPGLTRTPRLLQSLPREVWSAFDAASALRRAADPADIAKAVLFLASDLASYVTGNVLALDAGANHIVNQAHHQRQP
ncbi:MAG: SDR family oxidoreductase [Caulobacteraceae bacterium]|nr:SDR family oxidoreductase [Caulobacteraceae bacterium]